MLKIYKLNGLDCANCAAKIASAVEKVEGVTSVNVNFMASKITLNVKDEIAETSLEKVFAIIRKVDRHIEIV